MISEKQSQRNREWYQQNRTEIRRKQTLYSLSHKSEQRERSRNYIKNNREKVLEAFKSRRKNFPEKVLRELRQSWLKRQYGLTIEQYENLRDAQNGVCYICGQQKKLNLDHNHQTHQIRKFLCHGCNTKVGVLESSLRLKVEQYLKEYEEKT